MTTGIEIFSVMIADDHEGIRDEIKKLIGKNLNFNVKGEVGDGIALIDALNKDKFDCIVLDISMPQMDGVDALEIIRHKYPDMKVLVLSRHCEKAYYQLIKRLGAHGYVCKNDLFQDLNFALENVMRNIKYFPYDHKFIGETLSNTQNLEQYRQNSLAETIVNASFLYNALHNQRIICHFQPIYLIKNQMITGFEALVRIKKEDGSLLYPDSFIQEAERSKLIVPLGMQVFEMACRFLQQTHRMGNSHIRITVNVSPEQFFDEQFIETLLAIVKKNYLSTKHIIIEITETLSFLDEEKSIEIMHDLRRLGFAIYLDDFGSGFSSLSYLKKFPLTGIKIDKGYVRDIHQDLANMAIVESLLGLAERLNFDVVVEGVENQEEFNILQRLNAKKYQGYFGSRPVEAQSALSLLELENNKIIAS